MQDFKEVVIHIWQLAQVIPPNGWLGICVVLAIYARMKHGPRNLERIDWLEKRKRKRKKRYR